MEVLCNMGSVPNLIRIRAGFLTYLLHRAQLCLVLFTGTSCHSEDASMIICAVVFLAKCPLISLSACICCRLSAPIPWNEVAGIMPLYFPQRPIVCLKSPVVEHPYQNWEDSWKSQSSPTGRG